MIEALLNSLLYFPTKEIEQTPGKAGLDCRDLLLETEDGERLHGWWIGARLSAPVGHVLLCHGNAGNVGDRILHAALLTAAGFDVLVFDYRGYGASSGRPGEQGTYSDARAALACLLREPGVEPSRVLYLGESLGGGVALELALAHPPAGLVLLSTFTSVREIARAHYPFVPAALVPDAYPSLERIRDLHVPLLILHGECDEIVPPSNARRLFEAATGPKRLRVLPDVGHNDIVPLAGAALAKEIASWWRAVLNTMPGRATGEGAMSDPDHTSGAVVEEETTVTDDAIETRWLVDGGRTTAHSDDSDDTGDTGDDAGDTGDDAGDTGDDAGDPGDVSDTGDDAGDTGDDSGDDSGGSAA